MGNIFSKETAAGILAALALAGFYRWYIGHNVGGQQ